MIFNVEAESKVLVTRVSTGTRKERKDGADITCLWVLCNIGENQIKAWAEVELMEKLSKIVLKESICKIKMSIFAAYNNVQIVDVVVR